MTATKVLSLSHLAATGGLTAAAIGASTDWRILVGVLLWGFTTSAWAFSAGWDAALKPAKPR